MKVLKRNKNIKYILKNNFCFKVFFINSSRVYDLSLEESIIVQYVDGERNTDDIYRHIKNLGIGFNRFVNTLRNLINKEVLSENSNR